MVQPLVLLGALDGHDIAYVLHHTDGSGIAFGVAADIADISIADIVTHSTVFHLALELDDGIAESLDSGCVLVEQVQYQAHGGLVAYTW
jgi:hypothetical protein